MNYINDIKLKYGNNSYNIIIEIPKGTNKKFELVEPNFDKVECVRKVKAKYPFQYGCFPQTYAGDRDPLDAILLKGNDKLNSLDIINVKPIAVIKTIDDNEIDDKIICIPFNKELKINLDKLLKPVFKFLRKYKGKHSKMIIDNNIYDQYEAVKLINAANVRQADILNNKIKSF